MRGVRGTKGGPMPGPMPGSVPVVVVAAAGGIGSGSGPPGLSASVQYIHHAKVVECLQTHNHTDIQIYMTTDFWLLPRTYRHRHTAHGSEQYTRIHTWMDGWIEGREVGNRGIEWRKTGKYSNGSERKSERTNESTTRILERSPVAVVTVPVTDAPSTEHRAPSTRLPG